MKRVEVILTQAIEDDFVQFYEKACKEKKIKCKYTKINNIQGQGNTIPKMGDSIWPQLNTLFVVYCEEDGVQIISEIMKFLHRVYVGEGAAAFVSDALEIGCK